MLNTASNKVSKVGGIITAICLILLGILIFTFPIGSMVLSTWLFTAGVGIYGLFHILAYVKTPAGLRNGWQLAGGIMAIILFFIMLPVYGEIKFFSNLGVIMFLLAFYSISNGVTTLTSLSAISAMGGSKGLAIFSGILSLLVGFFMLCRPFVAGLAEIYFLAVWLIVIGVSMLCAALSQGKGQVASTEVL